jgi:hypothetical protein
MDFGFAGVTPDGSAQTAVKPARLRLPGENVFRLPAPDRHLFPPVGGGENAFRRAIENGRGCIHQINNMINDGLVNPPSRALVCESVFSSSNIARRFNQNGAVEHEIFGKLKTFQKFKTLLSLPFMKTKLTTMWVMPVQCLIKDFTK